MSKPLLQPATKLVPKKALPHPDDPVKPDSNPYAKYQQCFQQFIDNHSLGKLAKNLYKLILVLLEHQANNDQQFFNTERGVYDIRQLLNLLDNADRVEQLKAQYGKDSEKWLHESQQLLVDATDFVFDHCPVALNWNLCRMLIDFIQYELLTGYPTYINEFLPDVIAMLAWLNEGACLVKLNPRKQQEAVA